MSTIVLQCHGCEEINVKTSLISCTVETLMFQFNRRDKYMWKYVSAPSNTKTPELTLSLSSHSFHCVRFKPAWWECLRKQNRNTLHIFTHTSKPHNWYIGGEAGSPQQELGRNIGLGGRGSETIPTPSATCYRECLREKSKNWTPRIMCVCVCVDTRVHKPVSTLWLKGMFIKWNVSHSPTHTNTYVCVFIHDEHYRAARMQQNGTPAQPRDTHAHTHAYKHAQSGGQQLHR